MLPVEVQKAICQPHVPKVGMKEKQRGKAVEDPMPNQNDLILAISLASQGYLYVSFCIFYAGPKVFLLQ